MSSGASGTRSTQCSLHRSSRLSSQPCGTTSPISRSTCSASQTTPSPSPRRIPPHPPSRTARRARRLHSAATSPSPEMRSARPPSASLSHPPLLSFIAFEMLLCALQEYTERGEGHGRVQQLQHDRGLQERGQGPRTSPASSSSRLRTSRSTSTTTGLRSLCLLRSLLGRSTASGALLRTH